MDGPIQEKDTLLPYLKAIQEKDTLLPYLKASATQAISGPDTIWARLFKTNDVVR